MNSMERKPSGFSRPPVPGARSVLIAVDGSEHSKRAFLYYLKWLHRQDDAVTIFHGVEPVSLPSISLTNPTNIPSDEWANVMQSNLKRVRDMELDYIAECQNRNLTYQFIYESVEHTGEAIVLKAEKYKAHLLVVGSRGLGTFKRTIMGSVSDYVVHHANVSVCVVPSTDGTLQTLIE